LAFTRNDVAYFLIAVSNRTNLDLCLRYALAGFTNSINGAWTFEEISEGDFISFLYGARVFNLYRVRKKEALRQAERLPPWPLVTFSMSGKTYHFPFRLYLEPLRKLEEPLVRAEFSYVAENLLLRGGYRKTHFQADQTLLQAVSQMGHPFNEDIETLQLQQHEAFVPRFTRNRASVSPPHVFPLSEIIIQSLARQWLSSPHNLSLLLSSMGVSDLAAEAMEALGEKAFPEGHVDILIKEAMPQGRSRMSIIEVKTGAASKGDVAQLQGYMRELGPECLAGVLIAKKIPKSLPCDRPSIILAEYEFGNINLL
jgi:hypothetical protein